MKAFIRGTGHISAHKSGDFNNLGQETLPVPENGYLSCVEPDYREYINPMVSRRMSRAVKMGIYAAKSCLANAGVDIPAAIITGTGLGCIEDTEKFLISIIKNEEKLLNPTPFIQSTHNTVGSQIALFLKCHGYNVTYSHRGHSFENALTDSILLLNEKEAENVLTGGIDELTEHSYHLQTRLGIWKTPENTANDILTGTTRGNIAGEGAAFFLLSNAKYMNYGVSVALPKMISGSMNYEKLLAEANNYLATNGLSTGDVDLLLLGYGGDRNTDILYDHLVEGIFPETACAYFKHLSGDYQTVSSFATAISEHVIKNQFVPELIRLRGMVTEKISNILIYNHFNNINHAFILVQNAEV